MPDPRWLDEREFRAWLGYRRMRLLLDARIARDLHRDSGLSEADYDVLSALSSRDSRRWRLQELADRMLWSKSRLSRHVSRMEERGLVTRQECADDGRGAVIVLTARGLDAIVRAAPDHVESVRAHIIDLLTPEQLDVLGDIAVTVVHHLGAEIQP
ncbi:winged helix-turn-helix transcriptional regulator [Nonomuraea sp. MG754425]|uniref:MarR family winged helix-turn-helix transcriptional regulator n=1 Tax=Nonomuraea sp. MG754425 TaxID=2570319 RepID=UPI001F2E3A9F|nr:MarR family winged helix-turn-helix transcriptional regulator [Nonomuraea sp. MG754425]MCF6475409.1 winged helix-turn-helix transcriptional regulator [Nonomuraea sp. MG754425]